MVRKIFTSLFIIWVIHSLDAQQSQLTAYTDDFNRDTLKSGWIENSQYHLSATGTSMKIDVDKYRPWKGFNLELGDRYDFSSNPYVNVRVKGEMPFILHVYLVDINGKYTLTQTRVPQSDGFITHFFDMTVNPQEGFDITRVDRMVFAFNGASVSLKGLTFFDELLVGGSADKIASLGGLLNQIIPGNSNDNKILVTDIKNASEIELSGGESLITNITSTPVINEMATITFDAVTDAVGTDLLTITARGKDGFMDNTVQFTLDVEPNYPPAMDQVTHFEVAAGEMVSHGLTGLTDGNITCDQDLHISTSSSNQEVISDSVISVTHQQGSPYADLAFKAVSQGTTTITITLDDQAQSNNITEMQFDVTAYTDFNKSPVIDIPLKQETFVGSGVQQVLLTGIGDGDQSDQALSFHAVPDDPNVVQSASVTYEQGSETAILEYVPNNAGSTFIQLSITDDGGDTQNNGDGMTAIDIRVDVREPALEGFTIPLENLQSDLDNNLWKIDAGESQSIEYVTFDGYDEVLKITMAGKSTWSGLWYRNPEIDLSEHPYLVCDVYSVGKEIDFHAYFWDNEGRRNLPGAHAQRKTIQPGNWNTVILDFRGSGMIEDQDGNAINIDRIDSLLFNYNDGFGWPFHDYSGTLYIKNIRVGSDAAADVPEITPDATIDPVADVVLISGAGEQRIKLTGISDGRGETENVDIETSVSNPGLITAPSVSAIDQNGNADLTFTPAEGTGSSDIALTVSAANSLTTEIVFSVSVLDPDPGLAEDIYIDPTNKFQVIKGFGTFSNSESLLDLYVREMGATSVRIGLISNQIEEVNDNNDPYVLNRAALNYSALDFDYYSKLKNEGVETFILTSWSPPAWMKDNFSLNYQQADVEDNCDETGNKLSYHYYEEFAESMVAVVRMFQEEAGITLDAIGLQNEPAFHEPYASAILDLVRFPELITVVGERFEQEGITTRLYMPEQAFSQGFNSMEEYIDSLQANPTADAYCDIIATHGYAEDGIQPGTPNYQEWQDMWNNAQEGANPKELWMTETTRGYEKWSDAIGFAGALHGALTAGNVSLWNTWSFEGMQVIQGSPTPMLYTSSNYFKYVRPGARRIGATSANEDLLVSAYENNDHMNTTVIVVVNKGTIPQSLEINGEKVPAAYDVFTTSEHRNREYMGMIVKTPVFLPASSVTTLVEVVYNLTPAIAVVDDFSVSETAGIQQLDLTGITDGGDPGEQQISISAKSSNPDVISIVDVAYTSPSETATLYYEVKGVAGENAEITLTVQDNGGTPNGSVDFAEETFTITLDEYNEITDSENSAVHIYPNPVQQALHIEQIEDIGRITIIDICGSELYTLNVEKQSSVIIETGFLDPGIYMLELTGSNQDKRVMKVIKE